MDASTLIHELGGVAVVARLCDIRMPSVVGWRKHGVPSARVLYFRALAETRKDVARAVARADRATQTETRRKRA